MEKKKLSLQQIIYRILFTIAAIAIVSYFFPHGDSFYYEYEINKPWRYGRLTAPYDFPIYRSDADIQEMEDSLHRQVTPRFVLNNDVQREAMTNLNKVQDVLSHDAFFRLKTTLQECYAVGVISDADKHYLDSTSSNIAQVRADNRSKPVDITSILSEKDLYMKIVNDSLYSRQYQRAKVRNYIMVNLEPDTAAMHYEYSRLREEVSATTGIVLMDSRIVDQGEIVNEEIAEKLDSYRKEHELRRDTTSDDTLMLVGRVLLVSLILCSIYLFFFLYRPWVFYNQNEALVAVGSVTFMTVLTALARNEISSGVWLVPIGITTIVIATFHGSRSAFFCHIAMTLLCSFMVQSNVEYLVVQSVIGMIIIFNLTDGLTERSQLLRVSVLTGISYIGLYYLYLLASEGTLANVSVRTILMMVGNALLLLMSYIIIYVLEKIFHFVSGVTLVELCNLNKGLLDRLSREAPGTFEHSLHVSNIAANAAKAIKAQAQLVRTGALYHDIGKLWNPVYYTENQMGANPHDSLSIEESVTIIKKHVSEGLALAEKAKLPPEIMAFITTHHGHGLIKYFYNTWCNQHPNDEPDVEFFSYSGEDPKTREQAILMLADGVEAASKSLKETTEETITDIVTKIISGIVASGRLNNSKITLQEINIVKQSFIKDLMGIYHSRIAYPELYKKIDDKTQLKIDFNTK